MPHVSTCLRDGESAVNAEVIMSIDEAEVLGEWEETFSSRGIER